MPYYVIYNTITRKPESETAIQPQRLKANHAVLEVSSKHDYQAVMWDESTRAFIPRPPKVIVDRLERRKNGVKSKDIAFQAVYSKLNAADRLIIDEILQEAYEKSRYESEEEYAKDDS